MVKRIDEALGRLMDALTTSGLRENTIVLFTSDHACHFKTRNAEYKRSCHESSIRVPTALWGEKFQGGGEIRQLTSLVDLPATLLDACGIPVPAEMEGRSILPLVNREKMNWPEEIFVQISESQVGRAIRTQRYKYGVTAMDADGNKEKDSSTYQEQYLYDLEADPHELDNVVGISTYREVADDLKDRLLQHLGNIEKKKPTIKNAPEIKAGQRKPELEYL
jgi:arylsulfatase A-like enzyme